MTKERARIIGMLVLLLPLLTQNAVAHPDDYLNETLVFLTLGRSEFEGEYWFDLGWGLGQQDDFTRHNAAVEWGITDHWMVDGRVTAISGRGNGFDSGRLETRYRFGDEGTFPIDIAISSEVNSEREADGSTDFGIEPRLILSRDLGVRLNVTANVSEEIPLDSGSPETFVALGERFNWTSLVRVGSELQYNVDARSGSVIPQVWLAPSEDVALKFGYSFGLDQQPYDYARVALEVEF